MEKHEGTGPTNFSPMDRMMDRMDESAFACVPRYLVDELIQAHGADDPVEVHRIEAEIAAAAVDDVS